MTTPPPARISGLLGGEQHVERLLDPRLVRLDDRDRQRGVDRGVVLDDLLGDVERDVDEHRAGRPDLATRNASRKIQGAVEASLICTAHLVTGVAIATMSTAWNDSLFSWVETACPVMQIIGIESACAV